jgi:hypothetical protein
LHDAASVGVFWAVQDELSDFDEIFLGGQELGGGEVI